MDSYKIESFSFWGTCLKRDSVPRHQELPCGSVALGDSKLSRKEHTDQCLVLLVKFML